MSVTQNLWMNILKQHHNLKKRCSSRLGKVKKRKRNSQNNPVDEKNENSILDTRAYELEFHDGRVEEYPGNVLAENLLTQVGNAGWDAGSLSEIIVVQKSEIVAIPMKKGGIITETGLKDM